MPLTDHSDTRVKATTFIRTLNARLQGPRGIHGTRSVASQGTAAGKACAPQDGAHQAISSFRMRLGRQSQRPTGEPCEQSAVCSFGLRLLEARSTGEGELSHGRASLTRERESLWQGEVHAGESPLMLVYVAGEHRRTLLCPQQVSFLCDFLPLDVPL
jgi:hypothetical protein